jgi:hypothetical protein
MVTGAHSPGNLSGPPSGRSQHTSNETLLRLRGTTPYRRNSASLEGWAPPPVKIHLVRGLCAPSGRTPSLSRAGRPLGRNSTSLEGCAPPRAGQRLARGSRGSTTPTPTSSTGALNALTQHGRPGQGRIPAMLSL